MTDYVELSDAYLLDLSRMFVEMWPECNEADELEDCKSILASDKKTCFIALNNKIPIGFIYISIREDYVEGSSISPIAYVEGIYVREESRHKGVGGKLLQMAYKWASDKGFTEIASDSSFQNYQSIGFHLKNGFKEIARTINFLKSI